MRVIRVAYLCAILCNAGAAQTPIETQAVKELKPTGSLSTCGYSPSSNEKAYFEKLDQKERATGSFMEAYDIHKKKDVFVSWYGIVRGVTRTAA